MSSYISSYLKTFSSHLAPNNNDNKGNDTKKA